MAKENIESNDPINRAEKIENKKEESLESFIERLNSVKTYVDLEEFLTSDGEKRGYNGRALAKDIYSAIIFKPQTEQSALQQMDKITREDLMAKFRYMDDKEADALIEKVAWLIETDPTRAKDKEEQNALHMRQIK